jgi:hypothetical protein
MAHDIVISHSSKDKKIADAACVCLEPRGIRCWVAPRDIVAGADWSASISDAKAMVLILSSHSNVSKQVLTCPPFSSPALLHSFSPNHFLFNSASLPDSLIASSDRLIFSLKSLPAGIAMP